MKDPKDLKSMKFTDMKKDAKQTKAVAQKPSTETKKDVTQQGDAPTHQRTPAAVETAETRPENFAAPDTILIHKSRKDKMVLCLRINNGLIVKGIVVDSSRYTIALSDATIPSGKKEMKVKHCVVNKHAIELIYLEDDVQ